MRPLSASVAADGGDDLEQLSADQLAALEDEILLAMELEESGPRRLTRERAFLFVLTFLSMAGWTAAVGKVVPGQRLGILNLPIFLVALGIGVVTPRLLWRAAGRRIRTAVRWVLHHWVLTLVAALYLARLFAAPTP